MSLDRVLSRRWAVPAFGALLFLGAFATVFFLTLPREVIVGWIGSAVSKTGVRIEAEGARILFPAGIALDNASIRIPGQPDEIRVAKASVRFDPIGMFRGLPIRFRASSGKARLDILLSSVSAAPARGRLSATNLSSDDFPGLLPGAGFSLAITQCDVAWERSGSGKPAGKGHAALSLLKFAIPAPDSPVRDAAIRDALMDFTLQGGSLQVSSLRGKYEGAPVEGTGEIANIGALARAAITFHLKIPNPYEGNVAAIFNLVSKNAKNATLNVSGPLLSPAGEFKFF